MTSLSTEMYYICIVTTRLDDTLIRTVSGQRMNPRERTMRPEETSIQILAKGTYVEIRPALLRSLQHQEKRKDGINYECIRRWAKRYKTDAVQTKKSPKTTGRG